MKIIETDYFNEQVLTLKKRFKLIEKDIYQFKNNLVKEPFSNLWLWIYKYRIWNSSIPVWKRSWFRIIIFIQDCIYIPLLIYSKNIKSNVDKEEIKEAFVKVNLELNKNNN